MMALTMASVSEVIPRPRIGAAMGLLGTMSAAGTALGPALGGVLVSTGGWPAIFFATAALGGPTLLLTYLSLPVDKTSTEPGIRSFDGIGAVLLFMTLTAFALAATGVAGVIGGVLLLLVAVMGLGLFVRTQSSVPHPLVDLTILRQATLAASLSSMALVSTVLMATLVVGPFYLSGALGLEPAMVGAVMSIGPVVAAFTGHAAGRFVDRFGPYRMMLLGLAGITIGALLLALLRLEWGVASYIIGIVVMTAGYALFQTANNTSTMKQSPSDQRGVVAGLLSLARNLGLITGASAMGALFALVAGAEQGADPATGMRVTFLVAAILAGAAAAIHVLQRRAASLAA
jgi:MFS family permease